MHGAHGDVCRNIDKFARLQSDFTFPKVPVDLATVPQFLSPESTINDYAMVKN